LTATSTFYLCLSEAKGDTDNCGWRKNIISIDIYVGGILEDRGRRKERNGLQFLWLVVKLYLKAGLNIFLEVI
jgi:hypothetical protein